MGRIGFEISKQVIAMVIGLSTKGTKLQRKVKVADHLNQKLFLGEGEELVPYQGGFEWTKMPEPWDEMFFLLMKYFTLEGQFTRFYNYHLPLLNHFRHNALISFPFYLMSSLEHSIFRVKAKMDKKP